MRPTPGFSFDPFEGDEVFSMREDKKQAVSKYAALSDSGRKGTQEKLVVARLRSDIEMLYLHTTSDFNK